MYEYEFISDSSDPSEYYGRTIKSITRKGDTLEITFEAKSDTIKEVSIQISDEGQSCCEKRYMVIDDDLSSLVGQKLVSVEVKYTKSYSENDTDDDTHETAFLEIQGNSSSITVATHNEHNGFYGGFRLEVKEIA